MLQYTWSIYAIAAVGNLVPEQIAHAYLHAKELTSVLQIVYTRIPIICFTSIKEG